MTSQARYRVLSSDGLVSYDVFAVAPEQPPNVKAGCVVVVNQSNGTAITVHQTRLIPVAASRGLEAEGLRKSICFKCGRVEGVIGDQVHCPYHHGIPCGLLETAV